MFLEAVNNACAKGDNVELIELLSTLLVDVKHLMLFEPYPLFKAVENQHPTIIRTLVQWGVDINMTDKQGRTALHHAIMCKNKSVIDMVLSFRPNINIKDENDNTPLHYCVIYDEPYALSVLLEMDADIFVLNKQGQSPISLSIDLSSSDVRKCLEERHSMLV